MSQGTTNLSGSFTGSLFGTAATASYADNFTVGGTLTAQTINVQIITSSIEFNTGSTRNGALSTNTHQFTGSVLMSGSITVTGSAAFSSDVTTGGKILISDGGNATIPCLKIGSATTGISQNVSEQLNFITNSTTKMIISSSGNVGIGTTSPLTLLEVGNSAYAASSILTITAAAGQQTGLLFRSATTQGYYIYRPANTTDLRFYDNVGSVDRVTILQGGNVGIGTISPSVLLHVSGTMYATKIGGTNSTAAIQVRGSGGGPRIQHYGLDADAQAWMGLGTDMGGNPYEHSVYFSEPSSSPSAGRVTFGGFDGTTYNTKMTILRNGSIGAPTGTNIYNPSDVRLKQNISTTTYGLSTISALNPVKFNWIDNFVESENGKDMLGFIAQEVQTVIPEAIESFGSNIDLNGTTITNPLRVNEKFIIPVLVKAIQELKSENDTLKEILQRNNIQ